jgi:hypothetical protein
VNLEKADGSLDIEPLLAMTRHKSAGIADAFKNYSRLRFPLATLARLVGTEPLTLMLQWPGSKASLFIGIGTQEEREQALALLAAGGKRFVIDLPTMGELVGTGVFRAVAPLLGRPLVPQTAREELTNIIQFQETAPSKISLREEDGQYIREETTQEQLDRRLAFLREMLACMDDLCEVTPVLGPKTITDNHRTLEELLDNATLDAVYLGLEKYHDRIVDGMTSRGYQKEFALQIFEQIKGFSEYGFPESHAASFALLVYASCWLKHNEPAAFLAAMLNSQPLGFYSPNQLVQDAKRHGIEVRPVDVMHSDVDATLEDLPHAPAVRLGMRLISGLKSTSAQRIVDARTIAPFDGAEDLSRRANLEQHEMRLLAGADALASLSGHRRQQVWDAAALHAPPELLRDAPVEEDILELPEAPEGEEIVFDYAALGLTLRRHPMALLRDRLTAMRYKSSRDLHDLPNGRLVTVIASCTQVFCMSAMTC